MLLAVLLLSFCPLVVRIGGGGDNPFLFNAGWRVGVVVGCGVFLVLSFTRRSGAGFGVWDLGLLPVVFRRAWSWPIFVAFLGTFEYFFFSLSTSFVDVSVSTIIYSVWPIWIVLVAGWLFRGRGRYRALGWRTYALLGLAACGMGLVVLGESGGVGVSGSGGIGMLALGAFLALTASFVTAVGGSFSLRWGSDMVGELRTLGFPVERLPQLHLTCMVLTYFVSNLAAAPVNLGAVWISGAGMDFRLFGIGVLGGIFVQSGANMLWCRSNLSTPSLAVNGLIYLVPLPALLWLFVLGLAEVSRLDYFVLGAALIVAPNLFINFDAQVRWGFRMVAASLRPVGLRR